MATPTYNKKKMTAYFLEELSRRGDGTFVVHTCSVNEAGSGIITTTDPEGFLRRNAPQSWEITRQDDCVTAVSPEGHRKLRLIPVCEKKRYGVFIKEISTAS